ncbi:MULTISPECIES: lasso peptide biosynthesis PqqD family chaperone [unclassified Streptomyces]|uniref:lasso peptide biosynthesis PqqD family chaperone n=1 Tax=unclassified Streptomyces TaxID=2593676 RepID=UPI0033F82BD2
MALRFAADISTAQTDYGTVLLNERSGQYWELNPTATLIIETLLAGKDETAAADAVVAEFDIDRERARRDVTQLVGELRASGLAA